MVSQSQSFTDKTLADICFRASFIWNMYFLRSTVNYILGITDEEDTPGGSSSNHQPVSYLRNLSLNVEPLPKVLSVQQYRA